MTDSIDIRELNVRIEQQSAFISNLTMGMDRVIVGQKHLIDTLLIGLLSDGHILLEGVPGLAKTLAIKTLAQLIDAKYSRIQFTPDLLPADVVGTMNYSQKEEKFQVKKGPVFANFVLADEINRAPAKVQSALLEAMQEHQVTIGDNTFALPDPFLVMATQNPIEQEGTYPLSEAQTDRFMIKEKITYPTAAEEIEILNRIEDGSIARKEPAVLTLSDIDRVQDIAEKVYVDPLVKKYIADIVSATRNPAAYIDGKYAGYIRMGASPRATINFLKIAKASALISGRDYAIPDDVKRMRHQVLRHRIALGYAAVADNVSAESLIDMIVDKVPTP